MDIWALCAFGEVLEVLGCMHVGTSIGLEQDNRHNVNYCD